MWIELAVSFAAGAVSGLAASALQPAHSFIGKVVRKAAPLGIDLNIESDPEAIWAGDPNWIGFSQYFHGELPSEPPPPSGRSWRNWGRRNGGVDCGVSTVRITVISRAPVTVVMETPIVTAISERAGTGKRCIYPVGGAEIQPLCFNVDLDIFGPDYPQVALVNGDEESTGPLSWSLKSGEAQTVLIQVQSESADFFSWHARLPLIIDGNRQYFEVKDLGAEDFVFAGSSAGTSDYFWEESAGRWAARG